MKLPFFSIVIPLYNKEKYIQETILSVFNQTFQNFEIIIINDGSTDNSSKIVTSLQDSRIKIIEQKNLGVSVARNRGIKEAKAQYIAFLDADDLWLPDFLETIYNLIQKFPYAGLYATAYSKIKSNNELVSITMQGLPSLKHIGAIPNYFESIAKGSLLIWTSATCIPKRVFIESNIWFPENEKYGEDQYVWARVAMQYELIYDTRICSIYQIEAENNTAEAILKEKDPHRSIMMLQNYKDQIKCSEKLKYCDSYIQKHVEGFIFNNIINNNKLYALKQLFLYKISSRVKIKFLIAILIPSFVFPLLNKIRKTITKASKT